MAHDRILDIARNTDSIACCSACGRPCFEIEHSRRGPERLLWSKPERLVNLRAGRGSRAAIVRFCDPCLAFLGWKITTVINVAEARK